MKQLKKEKRQLIHQKYNGRCAYCGDKLEYSKMHVDHIIPLYRRWTNLELEKYGKVKGSGKIDNLMPSCQTCNLSKSTFTLDVWKEQICLKINRLRRDSSSFRLIEKFNLIKVKNSDIIFYFEKNMKL